ncbi:MAG: hypothetical protein PHW04_07535 [Candidatus Wallbacteria bacterium]|nr:hypothetical protein [Candidatus Wallbacteria bacterium]
MKYLGFLLHIYQPPTQLDFVIHEIVKQCYLPLSEIFTSDLLPKFTLNINYSLTEKLLSCGHDDIVKNLRKASETGNLEFTGSGAYHPIFPLIPQTEVTRQLTVNSEKSRKVFGNSFQPSGIFPPEMCFSSHLGTLICEMGYKWAITDDLPYNYYHQQSPFDYIPEVSGLGVFLRSNRWSNELSFNSWKGNDFINRIDEDLDKWFDGKDGYLIIALDGETFGHHHRFYEEKFLRSMLYELPNHDDLQLATLSEIFSKFPLRKSFVPPSTWSASMQDLQGDDPYPLWQSRHNPIHHNQWVLTYHVLSCVEKDKGADPTLRELMDKAIYSCQYWWASIWNFDPSQIYRGAYLLMDTLEYYAQLHGDREALRLGRDLYNNLVYSVAERLRKKS